MLSSIDIGDDLIITVKEARKLIGKQSENLTNEELKSLIEDTETLVRVAVRKFCGSKKIQKCDMIAPENSTI